MSSSRSTGTASRTKTSRGTAVFHDISAAMQQAMKSLEALNERNQAGIRSVDTDVAKLLTMLAITAPQGAWLELGTSAGYSTLWLPLAAKARGGTITTA